jgi:murein DD-endopeptidase MepM/ murein hydrolase activator NlpD
VGFAWPVDGPVLSGFGRRRGGWHAGVDIRAERGAPIRAAARGVVVFSGWASFYGNIVKIRHRDGFLTLYAHNLQNLVKVGDEVDTDTIIATVGRTGRASTDHVHFEIHRHAVAYDPARLLDQREAPVLLAGATDVWPPDELLPASSLALAPDRPGTQ